MAAAPVARPSSRQGPAWAGRASQHRRRQVAGGGPEHDAINALWESLVEVLRAIDSPSSALLCTADGVLVAAHGHARTDLPKVAAEVGTAFATRVPPTAEERVPGEVETVELTSGQRHTVVASVPGPPDAVYLLAVSAEGVSLPVLNAWTRHAAQDLREVLLSPA